MDGAPSNPRLVQLLTLRALSFGLGTGLDQESTVERLLALAAGNTAALERAASRVAPAGRERRSPVAARAHRVLVQAIEITDFIQQSGT